MFDCKKCEVLADEVRTLRGLVDKLQIQNEKLTDRLIAITAPYAVSAVDPAKPSNPDDYYGGENDELIEFDEFGQKVIRLRGQVEGTV